MWHVRHDVPMGSTPGERRQRQNGAEGGGTSAATTQPKRQPLPTPRAVLELQWSFRAAKVEPRWPGLYTPKMSSHRIRATWGRGVTLGP